MNKYRSTRFHEYYTAMSPAEKRRYARKIGSTAESILTNYIRPRKKPLTTHLKEFKSTRAQPSSKMMLRMSRATKGMVSYEDMIDHFYRK